MRWHTLSWLHDTLDDMSYISSIRRFTLNVTDQAVDDLERNDDFKQWRGIDMALVGRHFPDLQSIRFVFDTDREKPSEDMLGFLERRVPRLVSKGILSVVWNRRVYTDEVRAA
jgi:hypothetical protein